MNFLIFLIATPVIILMWLALIFVIFTLYTDFKKDYMK